MKYWQRLIKKVLRNFLVILCCAQNPIQLWQFSKLYFEIKETLFYFFARKNINKSYFVLRAPLVHENEALRYCIVHTFNCTPYRIFWCGCKTFSYALHVHYAPYSFVWIACKLLAFRRLQIWKRQWKLKENRKKKVKEETKRTAIKPKRMNILCAITLLVFGTLIACVLCTVYSVQQELHYWLWSTHCIRFKVKILTSHY